VGSDRIWRTQGAGFLGNPGPLSRELRARNSCSVPKLERARKGASLTLIVFPKAEPVLASIPISNQRFRVA